MSFIRNTSNPERLYVYEDCGGYIQWCWAVQPPLLPEPGEMKMPRKDFYGACSKWIEACYDYKRKVTHGKVTIEDIDVFTDTGDPIPDSLSWLNRGRDAQMCIRVTCGRLKVHMYIVTWQYIMDNVSRELALPKTSPKKGKKP